MRVKMKQQISGTRDGVDWPGRGEEIDLPADEAGVLLAGGLAEVVEPSSAPKPEKAVAKKATTRKG